MRTTVLQDLEKISKLYPNKIAYADIKEEYSFSRIMDIAKRIGSYLSTVTTPHTPVVIYMEKNASNISAFLGAVYAGCFYIPIDSNMPSERIRLILETLNPKIVIFDDVTEKKLDVFDNSISKINYKTACSFDIKQDNLDKIRNHSKSSDLLYVLFTSGSTGIPKGVTISHAAVFDFMDWICEKYELDENTILCNQAPFYFDASIPDLYIPIKTGATVFIPPKFYYTFPKKILEFIVEKEINTLVWVPSALSNVVNCNAFSLTVPTSIKLVIFCGEVMPCKHLNVWRKYIPDAQYVNMYGPTEATYACMYYDVNRSFRDDEQLPLGKACENCEIILLTENNVEAKDGEIGEICILGQCLSNGYYNNQNKTSSAFCQNTTNKYWLETMYKTGDLAYKKADTYFFAGRKDNQIKRLGHRIELGEIEHAIMSINGVENVCCIFNSKNNNIIAVFTGIVNSEEISKFIEEKLPSYMIPNYYVHLKEMPLNINGKIDRKAIANQYNGFKYE